MQSPLNNQERRRQLDQLLRTITSREVFAKSEIQALCCESKPRFVTATLKQLVADGVLSTTGTKSRDCRYQWMTSPEGFSIDTWIERQLAGNQVTQAPIEERPRERLMQLGAQNLKTSELFAILIRSGLRGESAVQAGQKLASRYKNEMQIIPTLARSDMKQVSKAVSEVAYCQIQAGIELGRRVREAALSAAPKERINSTQAAISYCTRIFSRLAHDARQEEFHIVTLDTKLQPISNHRITVGTLDASLVHPREVFRPAIRDTASAVLLVHNHPSGDCTPSRQDREVTTRLKKAGELLGINVIDHIIVARDNAVSLEESGC
ncbi:MAG: DNA repair protein RadC [Planctomycetales bacterium]|nr:DNA repair protein RadC [Planctomycetales bacterium]